MGKIEKLIDKILDPKRSKNVTLGELVKVANHYGWEIRNQKGSHMTLTHPDCIDILNFQSYDNGKSAKPYQVAQVRNYIRNTEDV